MLEIIVQSYREGICFVPLAQVRHRRRAFNFLSNFCLAMRKLTMQIPSSH